MVMDKKGQSAASVIVVLGLIAVVIVGIIVVAGYDTVDANKLGVKVRFGKIIGIMEPGLEYTGVFTHVEQYDMKLRKLKVEMLNDQASATDKDGQAVYGSISVNYRLKQNKQIVEKLYSQVGKDPVLADKLNLEAIIKEGFKQATVEYEAIEILQNRQEVKELAKANIKKNFPQDYFEILDIVVENIDFSPAFKAAIEAKKVATQNKLKEQEQVEVVKYQQQQEIERYKAEAEKVRLEAKANAEKTLIQAQADAERLRLQRQEITPLLNEQKMLDTWDGHLPQILIMSPDSQGLFLQLPQGLGAIE